MHTHGDTDPGHDSHGGSRGLGWELIDSIVLGCFVVICGLLAEIAYRHWRARRTGVRFDLTPKGHAAAERHSGPLVDREALAAELARLDAEDARKREGEG